MAKKSTSKPAGSKTATKTPKGEAEEVNRSVRDTAIDSAAHSQQLDPTLLEKISAVRSKVNETFGQLALVMMAIPRYRHQSIADLNHILLEPLMRDRVAIANSANTQANSADDSFAGVAIWASVSDEVDGKIREQIKAGVFPIRLKSEEWNSGPNNWLLDIIAPNQQLTTAVIANFGKVVKASSMGDENDDQAGASEIKIHPLITKLVDPEMLKKMGASSANK